MKSFAHCRSIEALTAGAAYGDEQDQRYDGSDSSHP